MRHRLALLGRREGRYALTLYPHADAMRQRLGYPYWSVAAFLKVPAEESEPVTIGGHTTVFQVLP